MNLAQFREQTQRDAPVCCRACGRRPVSHPHVLFVEADETIRRFPICDRCMRIGGYGEPVSDLDVIDEMVEMMARVQADRIWSLRTRGLWPPDASRLTD